MVTFIFGLIIGFLVGRFLYKNSVRIKEILKKDIFGKKRNKLNNALFQNRY